MFVDRNSKKDNVLEERKLELENGVMVEVTMRKKNYEVFINIHIDSFDKNGKLHFSNKELLIDATIKKRKLTKLLEEAELIEGEDFGFYFNIDKLYEMYTCGIVMPKQSKINFDNEFLSGTLTLNPKFYIHNSVYPTKKNIELSIKPKKKKKTNKYLNNKQKVIFIR